VKTPLWQCYVGATFLDLDSSSTFPIRINFPSGILSWSAKNDIWNGNLDKSGCHMAVMNSGWD
jgi:hypothetical protein